MPNRWSTSILVRLAVGLIAGVGTCGLAAPALRSAGIRIIAAVTSVQVPPERLGDLVTRVWDANVYVLWLAWVGAAMAIAAESGAGNTRYGAIAMHVAGELALLFAALLMAVHAQLVVGLGLVEALALLLALSTLVPPALAVWRNTRREPTRVFDVPGA